MTQATQELTGQSEHPYLERKGIPLEALQSACPGRIEIRQDSVKTDTGPYTGPFVFRELVDVLGTHKGYERILPERIIKEEGSKPNDKFTAAGSTVKATFTPIGFDPSELMSMDCRIIVCAGLAEGFRIHEATGEPVACGVGENSTASIAGSIRPLNPNILVAVDNDAAGIRAGENCGYLWAHPQGVKDWSDLHQAQGSAAIVEAINDYNPPGPIEAEQDQPGPFDRSRGDITELLYTDPPARQWIVQNRIPLNVAGILAAAGGTGKSMATLQLAVSICSGLDWLEMEISEPGSVLMVSAEDDRDEIHRRLARIVAHYSQNNDHPTLLEQISARLFIFDRVGQDNRLTAKVDRETQRTAMARSITEAAVQIDDLKLIVLDPLSRFDGGDPNDNSDGTRLIEAAESIRRATGATVLLPHHVSKAGIRDSNSGQEAVRGASGLVDGARWVGLMAGLRADDAESYGIKPEDAGRYVRFTTPKANYSAPWDGCWLERQAGGVLVPSELKPAKEERKSRKADAEYQRIVQGVVELIGKHGPMSKRHIEEQYSGTTNILKAGQKAVRGTITRAVEEGHLIKRSRFDGHTDIDAPDGNLAGVMANV